MLRRHWSRLDRLKQAHERTGNGVNGISIRPDKPSTASRTHESLQASSALEQSRDPEHQRRLGQRIDPEVVRLQPRHVLEHDHAVNLQHESRQRLLPKRDEHDAQGPGHLPAPRQERISNRQGHRQIQDAPNPEIGEREVFEIEIREPIRRHDRPAQRLGLPSTTLQREDDKRPRPDHGDRSPWMHCRKRMLTVAPIACRGQTARTRQDENAFEISRREHAGRSGRNAAASFRPGSHAIRPGAARAGRAPRPQPARHTNQQSQKATDRIA